MKKSLSLLILLLFLITPVLADNTRQRELEKQLNDSISTIAKVLCVAMLVKEDFETYNSGGESLIDYNDVTTKKQKYCSLNGKSEVCKCLTTIDYKYKLLVNTPMETIMHDKNFVNSYTKSKIIVDDKLTNVIDKRILSLVALLNGF